MKLFCIAEQTFISFAANSGTFNVETQYNSCNSTN